MNTFILLKENYGKECAEKVLKWCEKNKCQILEGNKLFLLKEIPSCPKLLFVQGDSTLLHFPSLAIVGTRNASSYGLSAATFFSRKLSEMGWIIVSGLARGIDAASHKGCLASKGRTVAVLGHGLDQMYPREHKLLSQKILEDGGCLVSEFIPGTPPLRENFPRRNRIISGLSLGALIIEAKVKSGSLITAHFSREFNREVFVVPGPFLSLSFTGSHKLIQEGAKLVFCIEDILEEFSMKVQVASTKPNKQSEMDLGEGVATLSDLYEEKGEVWLENLQKAESAGAVLKLDNQCYVHCDI